MNTPAVRSPEAIAADPDYQLLRRSRNHLGWTLTILMLLGYYGFIGLIAFDKAFLARPIAQGAVTTIGIPLALGLMVFTVAITGLYVRHANRRFDALTRNIVERHQ